MSLPKPANTMPRNHPHSNDRAHPIDGHSWARLIIQDGNHGCGWGGVTLALLCPATAVSPHDATSRGCIFIMIKLKLNLVLFLYCLIHKTHLTSTLIEQNNVTARFIDVMVTLLTSH